MIDEDDHEDDQDDDDEEDDEDTYEEKLSFASPTSIKKFAMEKRKSSHLFTDNKDNSISVSKIEEIDC